MSSEGTEQSEPTMSFLDHWGELQKRLLFSVFFVIAGFGICFYFRNDIFQILRKPYDQAFQWVYHQTPQLIVTGLLEAFLVYFKQSLIAGFILTCPLVFYQIWRFVEPALKQKERKYLLLFVSLTSLFFLFGSLFGYFFVFPVTFEFFLQLTQHQPITVTIRMQEYYDLASWMLLGFGLVFEAPLLVLCLVVFGILTVKHLTQYWKGVIVGIAFFSAIITPTPDVATMLLVSIPLMVLYGLTILIAWMIERWISH